MGNTQSFATGTESQMSTPERSLRRRGFTQGRSVTLADGSQWNLPVVRPEDAHRSPKLGHYFADVMDGSSVLYDPVDASDRLARFAADIVGEALRANYRLTAGRLARMLPCGSMREQNALTAALAQLAEAVRDGHGRTLRALVASVRSEGVAR